MKILIQEKKKKSKKASEILEARRKKRKPSQLERDQQQAEIEKARIKADSIAVVDVSAEDKQVFTENLDEATKALRNFMLNDLAPKELGMASALDTTMQELNVLLDGGVAIDMRATLMKLNSDISLIAMTKKMCSIYKIDKATTRKIIEAKIEFMRPAEKRIILPPNTEPGSVRGARAARLPSRSEG